MLPFCAQPTATRLAVLMLAATLAGCSALGDLVSSGPVDYRKTDGSTNKTLDVPPDLTQLSRDSRYQVLGGVVSASGTAAAAAAPGSTLATTAQVAPTRSGDMRIERAGQQRWLVSPLAPEQLWPLLTNFWEQRGFTLEAADAKTGVMETNWSMNRAKLPADVVRNTVGRLLGNLYDTGERDRYRTRLERTAQGSEVYITHRGAAEVITNNLDQSTRWQVRPSDPQLEAEFLAQLMVALGAKDDAAKAAATAAGSSGVAGAAAAAASPVAPTNPQARATGGANSNTLEVDDSFDRAWRRVGLALDRGGFTVEDRDRSGGLYYVRYVNPKTAGQEEPGFWARLFGDKSNPNAAVRYRIALKPDGNKTAVSVLTSAGGAEVGDIGAQIASQLVRELR